MSDLKIGLAQLECWDGRPEKNLDKITQVIRETDPTPDVMVFPESYVTGFPSPSTMRALAEPLDGQVVQQLTAISAKYQATLVVGVAELAGGSIYNTSVMIGPQGLLLAYRKTHLWVGEDKRVSAGNFYVARDWKDTRVGLLICYDVEFPETARAVASMGSEIIFLTNGNMDPYGPVHRRAITARAQENQVYVAMANRVGFQGTTRYVGESCVADPYGNVVAELGSDDEGVLVVSVDLSRGAESRSRYDYLKERRMTLNISKMSSNGPLYRLDLSPNENVSMANQENRGE